MWEKVVIFGVYGGDIIWVVGSIYIGVLFCLVVFCYVFRVFGDSVFYFVMGVLVFEFRVVENV